MFCDHQQMTMDIHPRPEHPSPWTIHMFTYTWKSKKMQNYSQKSGWMFHPAAISSCHISPFCSICSQQSYNKDFFLKKKKENCLCLSPLSVPAPFQDDAPYAGPHSYFSTKKNLLLSRPTNAVIWRYIACFLWVPTGSGGCFSDTNLYFAFRLHVSFTSKMQPWLQGT